MTGLRVLILITKQVLTISIFVLLVPIACSWNKQEQLSSKIVEYDMDRIKSSCFLVEYCMLCERDSNYCVTRLSDNQNLVDSALFYARKAVNAGCRDSSFISGYFAMLFLDGKFNEALEVLDKYDELRPKTDSKTLDFTPIWRNHTLAYMNDIKGDTTEMKQRIKQNICYISYFLSNHTKDLEDLFDGKQPSVDSQKLCLALQYKYVYINMISRSTAMAELQNLKFKYPNGALLFDILEKGKNKQLFWPPSIQ